MGMTLDKDYDVENIIKIYDKARIPVGLDKKYLNRKKEVNKWLNDRAISDKRTGLKLILELNNVKSKKELVIKNNALGLCDCYWIKSEKDTRKWENVNYFDNIFDEKGNNIYLGTYTEKSSKDSTLYTPNNNSSGNLPKAWIKRKDGTYLIKGSENLFLQEPYNEAIVSKYLEDIGVDHVQYRLKIIDKKPYSICRNMLNDGEDLISAFYVINSVEKDNKVSYLDHYISCCKQLGLKEEIREQLDNMIIVDYIVANTDRHWSNFGIIRDSETLEAKRLAPLFDNGASLFLKMPNIDIAKKNIRLKAESFRSTQEENIKLVNNADILKHENIQNILSIMEDMYKNNDYIDSIRKDLITANVDIRLKSLFELGKKR
jgi:hypothetical protein